MLPSLKNAAVGCYGTVKMELPKGEGLLQLPSCIIGQNLKLSPCGAY